MANRDQRGYRYPHSGFETSFEGFGDRSRSEQQGYEEERWRRNQEWSPSQNTEHQTGGYRSGGQYGSESPYGYGASGRSRTEYDEGRYGGGEGDFRSFQNREGSFGTSDYGYGSTRSSGYGGSGEFNRREMRQSRYAGGTGAQSSYGYDQRGQEQQRYGLDQSSYGQGGGGQQLSQGNQYGSQGGYESGRFGSGNRYGSSSGQYGEYGSQQGGYRGRGPKGYTRSDQRIEEDVNERLSDDYYLDASNLEVSVQGGTVTLSGEVDDRDAKRRAEDLAESCSGVQQVQNNIRVGSRSWLGDGSDGQEQNRSTTSSQTTSTGSSRKAGSSGT